jgi:hypothetical protein
MTNEMFQKAIREAVVKLTQSSRVEVGFLWESKPTPIRSRAIEKSEGQKLRQEVEEGLEHQGLPVAQQLLSKAHTWSDEGFGMVVVGGDRRVGIDLECSQRRVHSKVEKRILSAAEKALGISVLEAWVLKEAAFKSNPDNAGTLLPHYVFTQWSVQTGKGVIKHRNIYFETILLRLNPWLIGLASQRLEV